jgi:RNase P subunit RPR2
MDPDQPQRALCHKCGAEMIYVTSLPHPSAPETMMRTTFVCRACNQTRNYPLSIAMAKAYATAAATTISP